MSLGLVTVVVSDGLLDDLFNMRKVLPGHPFHKDRIQLELHLDDIRTTVHSEENPAHEDLFGAPRNFTVGNMSAGAHPRMVFDEMTWMGIVVNFASQRSVPGTWAKAFLDFTQHKGPGNPLLQKWANLDTSAYTGREGMNKARLAELAVEVEYMGEYHEGGMFMCALHAFVNEVYIILERSKGVENPTGYLPEDQRMDMAINVIVNYAKVLLSHYATFGCDTCVYEPGLYYSDLWSLNRGWGVQNDWLTGGLGMALSYDVLHDKMNAEQRRWVRSAIGLMVMGRQHWGITDFSNMYSPNAKLHPHRIFSNWATYHANLYLANCVIEGETDFDDMTSSIGVGFNVDIHEKTIALYQAFMDHSIYPEGSSFEDGYMYSLAFREGSLGFIALAKRGYNHIDTPKFRNFIYNGAQMHEPYRCGQFIGHSSGGGHLYPANYAMFLYTYPNSTLTKMMWAQRMGLLFTSTNCRIFWHQTMMQMAIMGGEHTIDYESPSGIPDEVKQYFKLSMYHPRRGILVARSDWSANALYFHFDARPDAVFLGHDNPDRGVITMSALGRTWLDELPWREYATSQVHSLVHVDGQAQGLKAPSVRMLKVVDDGSTVLSAADLTYAYNVQWARAWSAQWEPLHWEYDYVNGTQMLRQFWYTDKETGAPTDFGWVRGDNCTDLGITSTTKIWGEPNLGFCGIYIWKRPYRLVNLAHAVRSTVVVRNHSGFNYALVGDNFKMEDNSNHHNFSSYLILAPGVTFTNLSMKCNVDTPCKCSQNPCMIDLMGGPSTFLHVHLSTLGDNVDYSLEDIDDTGSSRLNITSRYQSAEKFCMVLLPNLGNATDFSLKRESENKCSISIGTDYRGFRFNTSDHTLQLDNTILIPSIEPSEEAIPASSNEAEAEAEPSESAQYSASASSSAAASSAPTASASASVSASVTVTPSVSETPTVSMTPSASTSYMAPPSAASSNTPSISVTPSTSMSMSSTPSTSMLSSSAPSESASASSIPSYYYEPSNSSTSAPSESASASSVPSYYLEPSSSSTASPSVSISSLATPSASSTASSSITPSESIEASLPSASLSQSNLPYETYVDPMDPIPLPMKYKFYIHEDELEYDRSRYYDQTLPGGQIVLDILVGQLPHVRTINTCFRYTTAKIQIKVVECGPFGESAYMNYYNRQCTEIENMLESTQCPNKDSDQFRLRETRWALYFVVISVEEVGDEYVQFAIKYL